MTGLLSATRLVTRRLGAALLAAVVVGAVTLARAAPASAGTAGPAPGGAHPALGTGSGSASGGGQAPAARMAVTAPPAAALAAAVSAGARQLVTVRSASPSSTYATLTAYTITDGAPVLAFGPWTARVGYNGIAPPGRKREGDGRTPSGIFGFSFYFGVQHKLAFSFPFRHAYGYDVWDDDPSSSRYNEWVNTRLHGAGADPEPMRNVPAYDYGAVISYNTARGPGRGSAIFLHAGTGSATAGCVSLPRPELIKALRWLSRPGRPLIAISAG
jgi:L,D-peptidoglycan transpeptidase YkuD (ErfK/YbiS/YcfS/YnhG family)